MTVRRTKASQMQDAGVAGKPVLAGFEHYIYAAGRTNPGDVTSGNITVLGARPGDLAFVNLDTKGSTPRTVLTAIAAKDKISFVLSGAASTDHVLAWMLLKARNPTGASRRVY